MSHLCVRYQTSKNGRLSHLILLRAFPAIGMAQDKFRTRFDGVPEVLAAGVCGLNICACTLVKVSQEICKGSNWRNIWRERRKIVVVDMR
jgi:hypothetical protein